MRQRLDRIRMAKYLQLLFHTALFWGAVWVIRLVNPQHGFFYFTQYFILYCALTLGVYACRGFDMTLSRNFHQSIISVFTGALAGCLIAIPVIILFYNPKISKLEIFILFGISFMGLSLFRSSALAFIYRTGPINQVFVIGHRKKWEPLIDELARNLGGRLEIKAFVNPTAPYEQEQNPSVPCSVLVADPEIYATPEMKQWADQALSNGCVLEYMPKFSEDILDRIPLVVASAFRNYYHMVFRMIYPNPVQRVMDLLVAVPGLFIAVLMSLVIIPAILIDSGFPVFYTQTRIGLGGQVFTMHKYRTMKNREDVRAAFADQDIDLITPVGIILRKFRLDEIPQLWDVLRGKMSIVGPRPEQPEFAAEYEEQIPFYPYRHRLRPGITGWAQIKYRYTAGIEDTKKKLEYDLYYLKNRDALLDIQIILKTAETMLGMRGAK